MFLRVRKEKTYKDFMKMYSLSIRQELRRAIGKNNMFVLAKQSHQHQQEDVSKGITMKSNKHISWGFNLFPSIPEKSNFAHRNSFFMSHVISLGLVRTCNLQVITSHREMSFELKGNANLIRYSD